MIARCSVRIGIWHLMPQMITFILRFRHGQRNNLILLLTSVLLLFKRKSIRIWKKRCIWLMTISRELLLTYWLITFWQSYHGDHSYKQYGKHWLVRELRIGSLILTSLDRKLFYSKGVQRLKSVQVIWIFVKTTMSCGLERCLKLKTSEVIWLILMIICSKPALDIIIVMWTQERWTLPRELLFIYLKWIDSWWRQFEVPVRV